MMLNVQEGDNGTCVIQVHEMGIHVEQLGFLKECLGWDPVQFDEEAARRLADLVGDDVAKLIDGAEKGDDGPLFEAVDVMFSPDRWQGLSADDRKLLAFARPIRIHTDIRMLPRESETWFGGEVLTPGNQFARNELSKLLDVQLADLVLPMGTGIRKRAVKSVRKVKKAAGELRLITGPKEWMDICDSGPYIAAPGRSGNDETGWSRLSNRYSYLSWVAGVQRPERREFWFGEGGIGYGGALSGRWIFNAGPNGTELVRPADQCLDSPVMADIEFTAAPTGETEVMKRRYCPILKADSGEWQRIVIGPVLVPEETHISGQIISKEEIEQTAHQFLAAYNAGNTVGFMHRNGRPALKLVESWIQRGDIQINGKTVKDGTWMMAVQVLDDLIWGGILDGTYTGFSIKGFGTIEHLTSEPKAA